ncbi:MAG: AAA family ATPase, partial [Sciscionella sp.]
MTSRTHTVGDGQHDFVGRHGLFAAVADWYECSAEPYFVVGGQAGTGKSAALQAIAERYPAVAAVHVCRPAVVSDRLPEQAAVRLATQLAQSVPSFAAALVVGAAAESGDTFIGTANAETVAGQGRNVGLIIEQLTLGAGSDQKRWERTISGPLRQMSSDDQNRHEVLIVVDALDEADQYDGDTTLTDLIAAPDPASPVRWLISSRYDDGFVARLAPGTYRRWGLSHGTGAAETEADVVTFLRQWLQSSSPAAADPDALITAAAEVCAGNFLFARLLVAALNLADPPLTESAIRQTPKGLAAILA